MSLATTEDLAALQVTSTDEQITRAQLAPDIATAATTVTGDGITLGPQNRRTAK